MIIVVVVIVVVVVGELRRGVHRILEGILEDLERIRRKKVLKYKYNLSRE